MENPKPNNTLILLVLIATLLLYLLCLFHLAKPNNNNLQHLQDMYNLNVKEQDESLVKIKAMYLYPIRGIKGLQVEQVEITESGIVGDRNWMIISVKTKKPIGCANSHLITFLRLRMENENEVTIGLQDEECFPELKKRTMILKFDQTYENSEYIEAGRNYFGQQYKGYKENDEICQWLSAILGEEAVILRAA